MDTEVAIIGGGPTSAAIAITLSDLGFHTTVFEAVDHHKPAYYESIPLNATPVLKQLGVYETVKGASRVTPFVWWGDDKGVGRESWLIERMQFDSDLKKHAIASGCAWLEGAYVTSVVGETVYYNTGENTHTSIHARFIVDASGRSARVARGLGVQRMSLDKLMAFTVTYGNYKNDDLANHIFVESSSDGWWYAIQSPMNTLSITWMTDSDLGNYTGLSLDNFVLSNFAKTLQLKQRISLDLDVNIRLDQFCRPASTSCLEKITGNNWLAAGDAACTYDPITSYGLTSAMGSGIYAAMAIRDHLTGHKRSLQGYELVQQKAFTRAVGMTYRQYGTERRWENAPFWKRRPGDLN